MRRLTTFFSALAIILASALPDSTAKAGEVIVGGAKGYVKLQLDQREIKADQFVRGFVLFKLESVRDRFGKDHDAVVLNGPLVDIAVPNDMQAVIPKVNFNTPLQSTIKVGHEYKLRFHIKMDDDFRKRLRKPKDDYAHFNPGYFRLQAMVFSPPQLNNADRKRSPFAMLTQQFKSEPVGITVKPASPGATSLTSAAIHHAIGQAEGAYKKQLIAFHLDRKHIDADRLLLYISEASGRDKAELVELYLSKQLPVKRLDFFKTPGSTIQFSGHKQPPVFLVMEPNQRMRMTFDVDSIHRMAVAGKDTLIIADTKIDFVAPSTAGLYEMYDTRHRKPWGWILVTKPASTGPADNLRPDTKELAGKVATALYNRDEKSLKSLAVPDFRSGDVIRRMKFKLGYGDIRYLKSLGSKNRITTRMQVNIAPTGEQPVFARELSLEFTRFGKELKLSAATLTDVD